MKFLIVEANRGKIVQSRIVEGEFQDIVKETVKEAVEKWNPLDSDFVAVRDDREWTLRGDEPDELLKELEESGVLNVEDNKVVARVPYYLISYENRSKGMEYYEELGVYVVTAYIDEEYRLLVEEDAADLTSGRIKAGMKN